MTAHFPGLVQACNKNMHHPDNTREHNTTYKDPTGIGYVRKNNVDDYIE
jgi:hypothetical protein